MSTFISILDEKEFFILIAKSVFLKTYYYVDFTFSIIDSGRVFSIPTSSREISAFNKWMVCFPKTGHILERFILEGKYFLHLKIVLTLALGNLVDIYDGPGLLCSKIKPSEKNIAEASYFTTFFQCVIYFQSYFHQRKRNVKEILEHVFQTKFIESYITLKEGDIFTLSHSKCFVHHHYVCITQLKVKQWLYFNVTIKHISHEYKENMLCNYGGIVIYDIINGKHRDISRLYYVHSGEYHYQTFIQTHVLHYWLFITREYMVY